MWVKVAFERPKNGAAPRISLPLSKSLSNRWRVLQHLFGNVIEVELHSDSDDCKALDEALSKRQKAFDFKLSGTALRFYLAVAALEGHQVEIQASGRGGERPIKPLLEVLETLGMRCLYLNEKHKLPLTMLPESRLLGGKAHIQADVSSQFLTSLLLVGAKMPQGLHLNWSGKAISSSYLKLTLEVLKKADIKLAQSENFIEVFYTPSLPALKVSIEPDWSSAAYALQALVMNGQGDLFFPNLKSDSLQPDAEVLRLLEPHGLKWQNEKLGLKVWLRSLSVFDRPLEVDCSSFPDLAIALANMYVAIGQEAKLYGLSTLEGKESKRASHLAKELGKVAKGMVWNAEENSWHLPKFTSWPKSVQFETAHDHRMAMSLALWACKLEQVEISEIESVSKSFPNYWNEMAKMGFKPSLNG